MSKRIQELTDATEPNGQYFVVDKNSNSEAQKVPAFILLRQTEAVTSGDNTIAYDTAFANTTNLDLFVDVRDGSGNQIANRVTNESATGFDVWVPLGGTLKLIAIKS